MLSCGSIDLANEVALEAASKLVSLEQLHTSFRASHWPLGSITRDDADTPARPQGAPGRFFRPLAERLTSLHISNASLAGGVDFLCVALGQLPGLRRLAVDFGVSCPEVSPDHLC